MNDHLRTSLLYSGPVLRMLVLITTVAGFFSTEPAISLSARENGQILPRDHRRNLLHQGSERSCELTGMASQLLEIRYLRKPEQDPNCIQSDIEIHKEWQFIPLQVMFGKVNMGRWV